MRPLHSLLVAVLVALLCAAAWFLVGSSERRVEVASAAPNAAPAGAAPVVAESGLQAPRGVVAGGERAELAPEPAASASSTQVAPTGAEAGTLTVEGRVVDASGAPVAGARVLAAGGNSGIHVFGGFPLDARGAGEMSWLRRTETSCGADGRFALHGLKPGNLRLAVRGAGFAPYDEENRALPAGTHYDLGSIELEPGVFVSGRVLDARGRPVEGADVLRLSEPGQAEFGHFFGGTGVPVARTAADGGFSVDQLAVGAWALRVESELHPHALVNGATNGPGERVDGLVVTLEEGEEIHGIVRGAPAGESFNVRALPRGAAREMASEESDLPPPSEPREAEVAADGTFQVRGVRRGLTYELGLTRANGRDGAFGFIWSPALATPVTAKAGERSAVLTYQPESALVFQALDKRTNQPVEEFTVACGIDWPVPQMGEDNRQVRARPEGRARVGNLRPHSSADKAQLRISAVGYSPFEADDLPLAVGQDTDLGPIFLEPLPVMTVRVLDAASGQPVAGANVVLSKVKPQDQREMGMRFEVDISAEAGDVGDVHFGGDESQRARTDEKGIALLTIPVGASCRLTVRHGGHAPWRSELFPAPSGPSEREVQLGLGGSVTAIVLGPDGEPVAGGRVEHQAPGAEGGFAELGFGGHNEVTDERGEARFEHLEPGKHRFRLAKGQGEGVFSDRGGTYSIHVGGFDGGGRGWVEAQVAEGATTEVEIHAPLEVAVEGRVREAGEALSGATVELARKGEGEGMPRMPFPGAGGPSTQTDGQGRFRLEGIEPGEYLLSVRHPSRAMGSEEPITVREADLQHDVDLSVAIVEGKVTDAAGKPMAGVRVWPARAQAEGVRQSVRVLAFATNDGGGSTVSFDEGGFASIQSRTDAEGRYQLRGVTPDVELQVRAEGKGVQPASSAAFRVGHDEVRRNVDLALQTAGSVEVDAQRFDGSPARNLLVTARHEAPAGTEAAEQRTEFLGEEGRMLLDGLAPGTWRLTAQVLGPREGEAIEDQTVEVKAGETSKATFKVP